MGAGFCGVVYGFLRPSKGARNQDLVESCDELDIYKNPD